MRSAWLHRRSERFGWNRCGSHFGLRACLIAERAFEPGACRSGGGTYPPTWWLISLMRVGELFVCFVRVLGEAGAEFHSCAGVGIWLLHPCCRTAPILRWVPAIVCPARDTGIAPSSWLLQCVATASICNGAELNLVASLLHMLCAYTGLKLEVVSGPALLAQPGAEDTCPNVDSAGGCHICAGAREQGAPRMSNTVRACRAIAEDNRLAARAIHCCKCEWVCLELCIVPHSTPCLLVCHRCDSALSLALVEYKC